ncbi:MAG TPA: hypothetical protein VGL78_17500 [Solirubrobacteraceae bacterium]
MTGSVSEGLGRMHRSGERVHAIAVASGSPAGVAICIWISRDRDERGSAEIL